MKLPLNLVRSDADRLESQRECGECTACCVLPRIPIGEDEGFPQGKRGYTPCQHLCLGRSKDKATSFIPGCRIYSQRPSLCRDYKCLWREGVIQGDERRSMMNDLEPLRRGEPVLQHYRPR
jgi:Fe-S-cluster containining protein